MRTTYVWDAELECLRVKGSGNYFEEKPKGPSVIGDTLPGGVNGMLSHADRITYDSKHKYYEGVRAAGCQIVGNETPTASKRELLGKREIGETVKRAMQEVQTYGDQAAARARTLTERR